MKKSLLALASPLLLSHVASAHSTGHDGGLLETTKHIVSQPDHLLLALAAAIAIAVVYSGTRKVLNKRK